jgi:hypothetical protein
MKSFVTFTFMFVIMFIFLCEAKELNLKPRILFIPLDARPPCLKLTEKMGLIGNAEVVSPPMQMLGNFQEPGQSTAINAWILQQDLKSFDAAIVVLDMIAYGGLVASRKFLVGSPEALARVEILKQIRKRAPDLKIYGQNVIMRLAPNSDGKNEAYREKLHTWAKISPDTDNKTKAEVLKLEQEIPAKALADYKLARLRNYNTNLKAIDFVKNGFIDYLILSQDDATPKGVHVVDRQNLIAEVNRLGLSEKIAVQPGADEVSMLLLARVLNKHFNYSPKIKAVYSSDKLRVTVMPFEDRPLDVTVSHHIKSTGSREVENENEADLLFYVFPSRHEAGVAEKFASEIEQKIRAGKRVIVADIDPVGDVQGGDTKFTEALKKRHLFSELSGYASWNTAGNTIGTALPHGMVFSLAETKLLKDKSIAGKVWTAQNWFMINRVMDDYYYHNLVRAKANAFLTGTNRKASSTLMSDSDTEKVEVYSLGLLQSHLNTFTKTYFEKQGDGLQQKVNCDKPSGLRFDLPWNRTFEANIDFDITCDAVN